MGIKRPRSREQVGECERWGALGKGQVQGARRLGSKAGVLDMLSVGGRLALQVQIMRGQSSMSLGFREEEGARNGSVGVVGLWVMIGPMRLGDVS